MKRNNKKGFTIVELVIVIAVIAILAAVLIPTFSGIIRKADESAVMQKAAALYKEAYALDLADGTLDGYEGPSDDADNAIVEVDGEDVTYTVGTVGDNKSVTFKYVGTKYTAEYNGTTEAWTATKTSVTPPVVEEEEE